MISIAPSHSPQTPAAIAFGLAGPRRGLDFGRRLWIGFGVAICCTSLLAGLVLIRMAVDYRMARSDLSDIAKLRPFLDTANSLSAERGPANSVMGEEPSLASASRRRLSGARASNDAALARLAVTLRASHSAGPRAPAEDLLAAVVHDLAAARDEVDRVAALPLDHRDVDMVQRAIQRMFGVIDAFSSVTDSVAGDVLSRNRTLAAPLLVAEMLGDLREHAGRIASNVVASVAVRRRLPASDILAVSATRGRLNEAWALFDRGAAGPNAEEPEIARLRQAVRVRFFGDGLALLDHVVAQGQTSGDYDLSAAAFTERFVTTLSPIEDLREAFLDAWMGRIAGTRDESLRTIGVIGSAVGAATLVLLCVALAAQRLVCQPLLTARDQVIALAEGRDPTPESRREATGGMRSLFEAITVLRQRVEERTALMRQLERQADTDSLTGLYNRRALDRAAGEALATPGESACLVLIDIDHFKAINDRHGHQAGDDILRRFGQLLLGEVPPDCLACRFGGEEFAVLLPSRQLDSGSALAWQIRSALKVHDPQGAGIGTVPGPTASFGVAAARGGGGAWSALVGHADAALYRAKAEGRDRICAHGDPGGRAPPVLSDAA